MSTAQLITIVIFSILAIAIIVFIIKEAVRSSWEFDVENVEDAAYDGDTQRLTFRGGRSGELYEYVGSGMVWHTTTGKRCNLWMEYELNNIWHKCINELK